ncbi:MAG TPA: autotransporter-associated beta strand repeat-containing protein [Verrucomicrobiae bacterium]
MAYYPLDGVVNVSQTPNLVPGWGNATLPTSGGSISGYISVQPGVMGNGLRLDNSSSYIQSGTMDPFTYAGTDAFTVMYWIRVPGSLPLGFTVMVSKQSQTASPTTYFRTVLRPSDLQVFGSTGSQTSSEISPSPLARWMHVAVVGRKSGTTATWQVYLDGQPLALGAGSTTLDPTAVARPLRFGATSGGTQAAPNTIVDEYYFYNTALTEAQINGYLNSISVPTGLTWYGQTSANWDASTLNWDFGTARYADGNAVTFDDNLFNDFVSPPSTNIVLTTALQPASVKVDSAFYPYRFSGAGKLSGGAVLVKNNSAPLRITTVNDYSGGTTLRGGELLLGNNLALGVGPVTLFGGTLSSDSGSPRTLTNAVSFYNDVNTTVTLGTDAGAGALTLSGPVDLRWGGRSVRCNTATTINGVSANGYFSAKSGPGTLTLSGWHDWSGGCAIREGLITLNSATFTNAGALVPNCTIPSGLAKVTVDSASTVTLTGSSAWLRLGVNGDTSATNQADISGKVWLLGDGRIRMSGGGTIAIVNLLSGGEVALNSIEKEVADSGFAQFNINGGTLRARASSTAFFQGIDEARILGNGLTVDTAGNDVAIAQNLLNGGGSGGLTKMGAGTLTLNGTNTYTGATTVSAGELRIGSAYRGVSTVTVADGATLGLWSDSAGVSARLGSATLGGSSGAGLHAWFTGQTGNPNVPAGYITNLTLHGTIPVSVALPNFTITTTPIPLIRYVNLSGAGTVVANLPGGVVGTIVNNTATKTIELTVTSIAPLVWTGTPTNSWDVGVSANWTFSGSPAAFQNGNLVRFDDSAANADVLMVSQLIPGLVQISNTAKAYSIAASGSGRISSEVPVALVKEGTNLLTLGGANDFAGDVIVKEGILKLAHASALGGTSGGTYVSNGASLNMSSIALAGRVEPIYVSGAGFGGMGALYSDNPSLTDIDSFRYVRLLGDTTVGAPTGSRFGFTDPSATLDCIGGLHKLTKVGGGWFQFEDAFINVGEIEVRDGVLQTFGSTRIATNGSPLVLNGGTLRMGSVATPIDRPVFFTNGTVHVVANAQPANNRFLGTITLGAAGTFLIEPDRVGTVSGEITGPGDLIKTGGGYLALEAVNTYTGNTIISNGVLELFSHSSAFPVGSIANSANIHIAPGAGLDVYNVLPAWTLEAHQTLTGGGNVNGNLDANGTIAPGSGNALGWLGIGYNLSLAGTNIFKITKDGGLASDRVVVGGYLTYGGVLKVVLTGATPLAINDTFKLYDSPNAAPAGSFAEIQMPAGYEWDTTQLLVDGTIRVTGVLAPPTLKVARVGNNLQFTWDGNYKLQAQTNSLSVGLSNNWFTYPGGNTSGVIVPIDQANDTVFFRLSPP